MFDYQNAITLADVELALICVLHLLRNPSPAVDTQALEAQWRTGIHGILTVLEQDLLLPID